MPSLNQSMKGESSRAMTPSIISTGRPSSVPSEMVCVYLYQLKIFFKFSIFFVTDIWICFLSYGKNIYWLMFPSIKPSLSSPSPSNVDISWSSSAYSNNRSSMPSLNESMSGIPSEVITSSRIPSDKSTYILSEMVSFFRRISEVCIN